MADDHNTIGRASEREKESEKELEFRNDAFIRQRDGVMATG